MFAALMILVSSFSSYSASAATSQVRPLDAGGGCGPENVKYYSGVTVKISPCINTDSDSVNGNGYVTLAATDPSKWSSCKVYVFVYDDTIHDIGAVHEYNCFSSPRNITGVNFGPVNLSKVNGHTYYSQIEVLGNYNRVNIDAFVESPAQCVGWFC